MKVVTVFDVIVARFASALAARLEPVVASAIDRHLDRAGAATVPKPALAQGDVVRGSAVLRCDEMASGTGHEASCGPSSGPLTESMTEPPVAVLKRSPSSSMPADSLPEPSSQKPGPPPTLRSQTCAAVSVVAVGARTSAGSGVIRRPQL